jgi:hypothetical protein
VKWRFADRKQHLVRHPVDELFFGLIVDQADARLPLLRLVKSLQVPTILDFDPVESASGGLELLDLLPRQFAHPTAVTRVGRKFRFDIG